MKEIQVINLIVMIGAVDKFSREGQNEIIEALMEFIRCTEVQSILNFSCYACIRDEFSTRGKVQETLLYRQTIGSEIVPFN